MTAVRVAAGCIALALTGCAVGPRYVAPSPIVPDRYIEAHATGTGVADAWWHAFGDPTLDALVERGLAGNLDLAAANARIAQARAAVQATRAGALPQVQANASAQRQRLSENGAQLHNLPPGASPDLEFTDYRASLDASWELDLWGRQRRRREAALARGDAAVEDRRDNAVRIAAEIARTYADVRATEARLRIAKATSASARHTLELVEQRVRAGEDAQTDANRARSEQREAEAALPALEADRRALLYALDVLIGEQPGAAERIVAAAPAGRTLSVPPVAAGLPSDLLRRRPDIRRAERTLAAETADIGVAVADLYPRISLTGSLGVESLKAGDLLESASRFWQVGPSLLAPLFDGGARRAEVRRQRSQLDEATAQYQQTILRALSDVETALTRLAQDQVRAGELEAARAELGRNLELSRKRYRAGEADLLEVLDVERRAWRLEDAAVQARGRVVADAVSLNKALGGGWVAAESRGVASAPSPDPLPPAARP